MNNVHFEALTLYHYRTHGAFSVLMFGSRGLIDVEWLDGNKRLLSVFWVKI